MSHHSFVDETVTPPAHVPARPSRHRRRVPPAPTHVRRVDHTSASRVARSADEQIAPQMDGGGSSGRGPRDDDDGRRRPERGDGNSKGLLVALGIVALGLGVVSARLLSRRA